MMKTSQCSIGIIAVVMVAIFGFIWGASPAPLSASAALGFQGPLEESSLLDGSAQSNAAAVEAVSTFHSIGLTWSPAGANANQEAKVRFRRVGSSEWRTGHPLWYAGDGEYRGSLVELTPDTEYEIELTNGSQSATAFARTWSENFPIAETIYISPTDDSVRIDRSGSDSGYILYMPTPDTNGVIDVNGNDDNNIRIDAHHVIVRGFTLMGARENAIELEDGAHDVVIEENDISGWGRIDERDGWGVNQDSAIFSSRENLTRVIVQRNLIHHPRSDSNNWGEESYSTYGGRKHHPEGPQAIYFGNSRGNHVIRYNEISSDEDHKFNDCIGGGANGGSGFPGNNSDIYGNMVQDCWDDALEIEGYNENVRVWGNYTSRTYMHIAARPTQAGPLYIWRNIADSSRKEQAPWHWDDDKRGHFLKSGNLNDLGGGRVYVYHNTMLQNDGPPEHGLSKSVGSSKGLSGAMRNYVSRNNIFYVTRGGDSIHQEVSYDNNDFDYDLYNGELDRISGHESNGIQGSPTFGDSSSVAAASTAKAGLFYLADASPGYDAGAFIPNFNDSFTGGAPDIGAHESGAAPMTFGIGAGFTPGDVPIQPNPEPTPEPTSQPEPTPEPTSQPEPTPEPTPEPAPVAQCHGLDQEAEIGTLYGMFVKGSDVRASGGGYVGVPDYQGNRGWRPDVKQRVDYCVQVDSAGLYRLKAWSYAESGYDNSFYVQIDGDPSQTYLWHTPIDMNYPLDTVVGHDPESNQFIPVDLNLSAGMHTVSFFLREDGTRLDRFAFQPLDDNFDREIDTTDFNSRLVNDLAEILEQMTESVYVPVIQ